MSYILLRVFPVGWPRDSLLSERSDIVRLLSLGQEKHGRFLPSPWECLLRENQAIGEMRIPVLSSHVERHARAASTLRAAWTRRQAGRGRFFHTLGSALIQLHPQGGAIKLRATAL